MSGGFSHASPKSFAWFGLHSYSWRTSPISADTSAPFLDRWPRWGSMRNGECFHAEPWVPPTSGKGGSAWPTPTVWTQNNQSSSPGASLRLSLHNASKAWLSPTTKNRGEDPATHLSLHKQMVLWDTPTACELEGTGWRTRGTPKLKGQAQDWPTPTARDHKRGETTPYNARPLSEVALSGPQTGTQTPGKGGSTPTPPSVDYVIRLNPAFVENLMGFPENHSEPFMVTKLEHWEMQCHLLLQHLRGRHWEGGCCD